MKACPFWFKTLIVEFFFWIQIIDLNSTHPMFLNRITLSFFWFQTMLLSIISFVILWNLLCSLLLYKRLPSKVTFLSLVLNVYFIGSQLFSEGKLYLRNMAWKQNKERVLSFRNKGWIEFKFRIWIQKNSTTRVQTSNINSKLKRND